ncbi:MAG: transporter [Gemmatales bacterium]|nr:transporter [Gemmatales bacterium]
MHGTPKQSLALFLAIMAIAAPSEAEAQGTATLGVPRQGRIVPASQITALASPGPSSPSPTLPKATLGTPRKTPASCTHVETNCLEKRFAATTQPVCYAQAREALQLSREVPIYHDVYKPQSWEPYIVRGSVDESYLQGVPGSNSFHTAGTGPAPPWDWFNRTVHDTGLGQYFEWFQIRNTFQSDHAFDEFVSPVTNPFFFEDPRALTELRPVFIFQNTPRGNPLFRGGNIQMFSLQGRLALNERLSIVVPKLGLIAFQPDPPSPLGDEIGFAEIIVGPKLTFWRDDAANVLAAFGVHFEIPAGGGDVFQNTGSGAVVPYLTLGKELLDNLHFLGAIGYRAGFDSDRSDSFFVSLHADYEFYRIIYPFIEVNWFHYTSGGNVLAGNFEGGDLFNFGSTGASGEDIVTMGVGGRVKILGEELQAGAAFEFPLTKGKDIMDWRITIDLIWRY